MAEDTGSVGLIDAKHSNDKHQASAFVRITSVIVISRYCTEKSGNDHLLYLQSSPPHSVSPLMCIYFHVYPQQFNILYIQ